LKLIRRTTRLDRLAAAWMPAWMPRMARYSFGHEIVATLFFTLALMTIEGGVVAVFARQTFDGIVPRTSLNFAVAVLGAMNELGNILSFMWTPLAAGRRIIPFINGLQIGVIGMIAMVALLPTAPAGLWMLVLLVLLARLCWSGMITMRTGVWRSNYPARVRARIVGMVASMQVLIVAAGGAGLGYLLDHNREAFRYVIPVACVLALIAVRSYRRIRVRHEWKLLRPPRPGHGVMKPWMGPLVVVRVLRQDRRFAQFMYIMFLFGFGNLMVNPILVITLREQFGFKYFASILVTSSIQQVVQIAFIPLWAKFLDRAHVVKFRSWHSWVFVAGTLVFLLAAAMHRVELMFVGAGILGIAMAGGALAWNLGHVDFSPPSETSHYMATHVTLNGVRGLLAPVAAVSGYELLRRGGAGANAGAWMLFAAFIVNVVGACGFVWLRVSMQREQRLGVDRHNA